MLALAQHFDDGGDFHLAILLRIHWPACRQRLRDGDTVEQAVERIRTIRLVDLARLAARARESEVQRLTGRGD